MKQQYIVIQDFKKYQKNQIIQLQQNDLKTTLLIVGQKIERKQSTEAPCFTVKQKAEVSVKSAKKTTKKKSVKK